LLPSYVLGIIKAKQSNLGFFNLKLFKKFAVAAAVAATLAFVGCSKKEEAPAAASEAVAAASEATEAASEAAVAVDAAASETAAAASDVAAAASDVAAASAAH